MKSLQILSLKGWGGIAILYILLLGASFLFEKYNKSVNESPIHQNTTSVSSRTILVFPNLEHSSKPFNTLKKALEENYSISEVNYSKLDFEELNYSAENYAKLIHQHVLQKGISSFFVMSEGFGAVIAASFIDQFVENTDGLILYDPKGIQELELLGGYNLNKGVYSLSTMLSLALENLIPDFGYISKTRFSYQISKTRLDTDLRALKNVIRDISIPTLILSSSLDSKHENISTSEFSRLISNSKKIETRNLNNQSKAIESFLSHAKDLGVDSSIDREIKSLLPFSISKVTSAKGWLLIGLMLLIVFSTFISEDLACIGAGMMVARGLMGFLPAVTASFMGIFVGDLLIYMSGRWLGRNATKKIPFKWFINENDIKRSNQWFQAKGPAIILISRFIPGTRFPTYFTAGIIGASFWMFITYFGIASLLWTPILVGSAVIIGQELISYFSFYQEHAFLVLVAVVLIAIIIIKFIIPLFTNKGRRLLYGKFQRLIRWEFWSPFILYSPVVIYIVFLWFKFRRITVVTAANPGIEEGGFIGESKAEILSKITKEQCVAKFVVLDPKYSAENLVSDAQRFIRFNNLMFPVVIKPDIGERGKGVQIIDNEESLKDTLLGLSNKYILQEYIGGREFGILYYRYPNEEKGHLFSITKKEQIFVTGDGKHTLEELILKDSRAVCMVETHFNKHIDDLFDIPKQGEKVKLVDLGTHSRGALFLDGRELITDKLTDQIDIISKSFDGFYFGRYDVKVDTEEDLKSGLNIKVLEINGVTSESTNIYDPNHSFFFGVKTLCKQWKIAFEIGDYNFKDGNEIPSLKYMINLIWSN